MHPSPDDKELGCEAKFSLSNHKIDVVIQWLRRTCIPDPNFAYGVISSIYYDTRQLDYMTEKINSDYLKTKVRLRWYGSSKKSLAEGIAFAEVKYRIGSRRDKIRIQTALDVAELCQSSLENPKLLVMDSILKKAGIILKHPIFPVFIIRYYRQRYIERVTGARVCIDYGIHVPKVNRNLLPNMKKGFLDQSVFELKGNSGQMPTLLQRLVGLGCKKSSFSKYFACYQLLTKDDRLIS